MCWSTILSPPIAPLVQIADNQRIALAAGKIEQDKATIGDVDQAETVFGDLALKKDDLFQTAKAGQGDVDDVLGVDGKFGQGSRRDTEEEQRDHEAEQPISIHTGLSDLSSAHTDDRGLSGLAENPKMHTSAARHHLWRASVKPEYQQSQPPVASLK